MMMNYNGEHAIRWANSVEDLYFSNPIYYQPRKASYRHSSYDWFLIPEERYSIPTPELKESYVDVPGAMGALDYTEALTLYPTYKDIEGSMTFIINNERQFGWASRALQGGSRDLYWDTLYYAIKTYLHGQNRYMLLEDDPKFYYYGRFTVGKYDASENNYSKIIISYKLQPFRYLPWIKRTQVGPMVIDGKWDEKDIYFDAIDFSEGLPGANDYFDQYLNTYQDVEIDSESYNSINFVTGMKPVVPKFTFEKLDAETPIDVYIKYESQRLGIPAFEIHVTDENAEILTYQNRQIIFINLEIPNSILPVNFLPSDKAFTIRFKGQAKMSVDYEVGVL